MSSDWQWREVEQRKDRLDLLAASLGWRKDRLHGHCVDTEPGRTGYRNELSFVALLDRYKAQDGAVKRIFVDEPACGEHVTAEELAALDDEGRGGGGRLGCDGTDTLNRSISVMEGRKQTVAAEAALSAVADGYRPRYYSFGILSSHIKQLELVYNRTAQLNNSLTDRPASSQLYGDTLNLAITQLEKKIAKTLIELGQEQQKVLARHKFRALEAETERYKSLRRSTSRFIKNDCTHEEQPPENALKLGLNIPFSFIC